MDRTEFLDTPYQDSRELADLRDALADAYSQIGVLQQRNINLNDSLLFANTKIIALECQVRDLAGALDDASESSLELPARLEIDSAASVRPVSGS